MTEEEKAIKKDYEDVYGAAPKLDLSKVKNIKQSKIVTQEVREKAVAASRKSKFSFTEEHQITVPTKGFLYQDSDDEDAKVGNFRIRPMTLADEEILANQSYYKNYSMINRLLNACILNDFDAKDLCPYDMWFLVYYLREITYGQNYKLNLTCGECGKKFEQEVNVSDLEFQTIDEPTDTIRTVKLPSSKYTVTLRMVKAGDDEDAYRIGKTKDYDEIFIKYSLRTQEILDDKNEPVNPADYCDFYMALPGNDRAALQDLFKDIDKLKLPEVISTCPKCGEEITTTMLLTPEFFRY